MVATAGGLRTKALQDMLTCQRTPKFDNYRISGAHGLLTVFDILFFSIYVISVNIVHVIFCKEYITIKNLKNLNPALGSAGQKVSGKGGGGGGGRKEVVHHF